MLEGHFKDSQNLRLMIFIQKKIKTSYPMNGYVLVFVHRHPKQAQEVAFEDGLTGSCACTKH